MNPDFEVDTDELRQAASALSGTADRVTAGASAAPAVPHVPRWRTVDAATLAAVAARRQLAALGHDFETTARRMAEVAEAYAAADARAVSRLRSSR
ncbi:hypothetical protein GCM10010172_14060 [Paractinoplanes ferrugineus]|uniref:Excreted virulence factor EspC (Type VII ESX diderm) n=1 Tax=Paractinoplanes ferrugineus TaxID=113564 RepID=A0A919IVU4_9ACTN|nr:hypothetical protein [Actinoplanes ferrugineus]GIE09971.1 hypothetical protein Afe05nite_18110 [Actinoplanes ferrugineus]